MPGIVGLITKMPRQTAERELSRMVEAIHHEPFYATGTWVDENLGVYIGWAARKNSFADGMPLRNERGDIVMVFSGEEYAEPETVRRLKQEGHTLSTEESSYLVHQYEDDCSFPVGLNGRFHGLVADRGHGLAMLFNDRYGMHRLYYHEAKEGCYFSAEAKAILAVRPELRSVDPRGLGEFISLGCVLENRTLFKGIGLVPPAAAWLFRAGVLEKKRSYFHPREWEDQTPLMPDTYHHELSEVFARNLPRYFKGQEPIGMSLTGGFDTRMIMAWHNPPAGSLPCYTFGGKFRDCRDVTVAKHVARACGQSHKVIQVGDDFLSRFPYYAERTVYLTDGCADVSRAPDLYVQERARTIAPVRMTGLFGDELLRQLRVFKPVEPAPDLFSPEILSYVRRARATYTDLSGGEALSFNAFRQAPWYQYGNLALEQTQVAIRTAFLDNDFVRTVFRAPKPLLANNDLRLEMIRDGNPALGQIPTDLGFGRDQRRLTSSLSRAWFTFTFKAEYAYDYGMPQWVARIDHLFRRLRLERLFLGRHKFYHFRLWYRDTLSNYLREILLDRRTLSRPYIESKGLEVMLRGHLNGNRNHTTSIHKALTLEHLHRLFVDAV